MTIIHLMKKGLAISITSINFLSSQYLKQMAYYIIPNNYIIYLHKLMMNKHKVPLRDFCRAIQS